MIWKLVKYYNTSNEHLIGEYNSYDEAFRLFETLNTENGDLSLEIYFEDEIWDHVSKQLIIARFVKRSAFDIVRAKIQAQIEEMNNGH